VPAGSNLNADNRRLIHFNMTLTGTNKVPHRYAAILIACAAASSLAGESRTSVTVSLHQVPVSYVGLGPLVVELGTATLPDLVETVGAGIVRHNGIQDHDGRGYEVCLSYPGGLIRFTADSEMGGPGRTVTDFLVEATAKSPADCPALPERFTPLRVDGWLSIDRSRIAVEEHFQNSAGRGRE
jgi:hypothetical protein